MFLNVPFIAAEARTFKCKILLGLVNYNDYNCQKCSDFKSSYQFKSIV